MEYQNVKQGVFLERPNRFIAMVELEGKTVKVHVKNTGRCAELLVPGATVYVQDVRDRPQRKTGYDLIAVIKEEHGTIRLINMDSQAPNQVVLEGLRTKTLCLPGFSGAFSLIRPEKKYGESRFDVYLESEQQKAFVEVKGVTLENRGVVRFPDAPTERGVKHVKELIKAKKAGFLAYVIFVIQMDGVGRFEPNEMTHAAFGEALREAKEEGVEILAYDCTVTPEQLLLKTAVPVHL